jgi:Ca-activated chloride channel family protein
MANGQRVDGGVLMQREWRVLVRFVLEGLAAGLVASLVFGLAVFIVTSPAIAASALPATGGLYLKDEAGTRTPTPLLLTDVRMRVTGIVNRVTVEQRFVNPTDEWREGVYVFPLPDMAAVDHLRMTVGERVIEGMIKERGEARRTYEAARSEGRKATLLDEERPNMFTTSVANIGPHDEIVIAIEYQEAVRYDQGTFRLRFPMAITPRYTPGEAETVATPVVDRSDGYVLPVRIAIDLDAGVAVSALSSTYHAMDVEPRGDHRYRLTLRDGPVPAARDFELAWTPDVGAAPATALFTETKGGRTYALLMALPPAVPKSSTRVPREVTYIIDTSGSMEGESIKQAKEALLLALDRLQAGDAFNVIEFNSVTRPLYSAPVPVDGATLEAARRFVTALRADGGTEMLPALKAALGTERTGTAMRQVVFLTDGAVGNETELLRLIEARLGDRRLFTIGIGAAPNAYFLKKAAEAGRGTFTFIGDVREVKAKMAALIRKIENPVLTDIDVVWPGGVTAYPGKLPDLYAGEPVILTAELQNAKLAGDVTLAGMRAGKPWTAKLGLATGAGAPGVGVLWARDKIEALMDAKRNGAPADEIRRDVVAVALEHHLVSAYTSLVAVDVTPAAPAGVDLLRSALPTNLPGAPHADAYITGLPQTATPAPLMFWLGAIALLLATALWGGLQPAGSPRRTGA